MISMRMSVFLNRLRKEGRLKLDEPSDEITASYLKKSDDCLRSGKILLENDLYENSVSECYYSMYNALTALLSKTGIKCENHTGSIMMLSATFRRNDLSHSIDKAKKERIDKQYYVSSESNAVLTSRDAREMVRNAEEFILEIKLMIDRLKAEDIEEIRKRVEGLPD